MRYFHNFYGIYQIAAKWALITGFDIGAEQKTKGSANYNLWFSSVLIARYSPTKKHSISVRAEYYQDKHGVIISTGLPNGIQTFGFSANFDYAIQKELLWRIEARSLRSENKLFQTRNSTLSSVTNFITTSFAFSL
jgi:hypothetical protein